MVSNAQENASQINGLVAINKPTGITSNGALNVFKKNTGIRKCGFAGTLDPFASGVLIIGCNKGTKMMHDCVQKDKEYVFEMEFGQSTDTGDPEGEVIARSDVLPSSEEVQQAISKFTGVIKQAPSIYSAVKHNGSRLCDLLRKGMTSEEANAIAESKAKNVTIKHLSIIESNSKIYKLKVVCGAGLYVRKLASDLAHYLGSEAYVVSLQRTKSANFNVEQCLNLSSVSLDAVSKILQPLS